MQFPVGRPSLLATQSSRRLDLQSPIRPTPFVWPTICLRFSRAWDAFLSHQYIFERDQSWLRGRRFSSRRGTLMRDVQFAGRLCRASPSRESDRCHAIDERLNRPLEDRENYQWLYSIVDDLCVVVRCDETFDRTQSRSGKPRDRGIPDEHSQGQFGGVPRRRRLSRRGFHGPSESLPLLGPLQKFRILLPMGLGQVDRLEV